MTVVQHHNQVAMIKYQQQHPLTTLLYSYIQLFYTSYPHSSWHNTFHSSIETYALFVYFMGIEHVLGDRLC